MFVAVLVRRLKEGVTYEQFKAAWIADPGHFGANVTVTHARGIADEREIVSYSFIDASRHELDAELEKIAAGEQDRHDRIDDLLDETVSSGIYEVLEDVEMD